MKRVARTEAIRQQPCGKNRGFDASPRPDRVASWALLLNGVWEYTQCALLYDMHGVRFWPGALLMAGAVGGDALVVVALYQAVDYWALSRPSRRPRLSRIFWGVLILLSLAAAVALEYLAVAAGLWHYNARMRTIPVAGERVGLSPLLQITFLPALSIWLAGRCPAFPSRRGRRL